MEKRPKAGIYSIVRSERHKVAVVLLRNFCANCHWDHVTYVDYKIPKAGEPSNWQRFLDDISQHRFNLVAMWYESEGMQEYCEQYDTRFEIIDPFIR